MQGHLNFQSKKNLRPLGSFRFFPGLSRAVSWRSVDNTECNIVEIFILFIVVGPLGLFWNRQFYVKIERTLWDELYFISRLWDIPAAGKGERAKECNFAEEFDMFFFYWNWFHILQIEIDMYIFLSNFQRDSVPIAKEKTFDFRTLKWENRS